MFFPQGKKCRLVQGSMCLLFGFVSALSPAFFVHGSGRALFFSKIKPYFLKFSNYALHDYAKARKPKGLRANFLSYYKLFTKTRISHLDIVVLHKLGKNFLLAHKNNQFFRTGHRCIQKVSCG